MLKKVDHIGIAVRDITEALRIYTAGFGLEAGNFETVESMAVKLCFMEVGGTKIELLQGTTPDSPITKFIGKKGEGIHHICYQVEDISACMSNLKKNGFRLTDEIPKCGAMGAKVAFIPPDQASGVLIELKEKHV